MNRGTHANQHKHTAASIGMVWLPQFAEVWPDRCHSSVGSVKKLCSRWHQAHQMRNPSSASDTFSRSTDEVGDILHKLERRDDPRRGGAQNHDRVFVGADNVPGAGTGADAGAAVTILSNFSSSGLKTNSLSCGVSMAWTHTCRLTPMSPR